MGVKVLGSDHMSSDQKIVLRSGYVVDVTDDIREAIEHLKNAIVMGFSKL